MWGASVQRPNLKADDILRAYARLGPNCTHTEIADWLSDELGLTDPDRYTATAVAMQVSRNREEWRKRRIVLKGDIDTSPEFSAWPKLPTHMRDLNAVRFLQYCARVRAKRPDMIPKSRRAKFYTLRDNMLARDEVWRLNAEGPDSDWRLYRDKRGPYELKEDPNHTRFYESRKAFCERFPGQCLSNT